MDRTECTFVGDPNTDIDISCDDPIAVDTSGRVHGVRTDMRLAVTADGRTVEDAFYARRWRLRIVYLPTCHVTYRG